MILYEAVREIQVSAHDIYKIHQAACSLVPHLKVEGEKQNFLYTVHEMAGKTFLLLRSGKSLNLPGQIEVQQEFITGETITLACQLSIALVDGTTKKTFYPSQDELDSYLTKKIQNCGLQVKQLRYSDISHCKVTKRVHSFSIPWVHIVVDGIVTDPGALEIAFARGFGGKLAFGFGMLRKMPRQHTAEVA